MIAGKYELLFTFPCLYPGWEVDYEGYVIKDEKGRIGIITTDHGQLSSPRFGDEAQKIIDEKISEHNKWISELKVAKGLLDGEKI